MNLVATARVRTRGPIGEGLPRPALAAILGMVAAAVVAAGFAASAGSVRLTDAPTFAVIAVACALGQMSRVEAPGNFSYQLSLPFLFAGTLILPTPLVAPLVIVALIPEWVRYRYRWYMQTSNIANLALSALAAHSVVVASGADGPHDRPLALAMALAATTFVVVNHGLLAVMLRLARGHRLRDTGLFSKLHLGIAAALASLGACFAFAWEVNPPLAAIACLPVALIYQGLRVPALEEKKQQAVEQGALRRVATAVAQASPDEVFALAAEEAGRILHADAGLITRFDEPSPRTLGVWVRPGREVDTSTLAELPLDEHTALAEVRRTGQASRGDGRRGSEGLARALRARGPVTDVAAPIRVHGRDWGAVSAVVTPVPPEAEERLQSFAELVAIAIANAESRDRLATQASTDPLTGLANHRTFHERLAAEVQRARRYGRKLSLAILDLDHFKAVNDRHGHVVGDLVLAEFASRMAALCRTGELVARIGGEEFAWLLPETDADGAEASAERVRAAIAAVPFPTVGTLTVSAGICDLEAAGGAGDSLLRLADGALYWAKAHGRDTVCRYSPGVVMELSDADRADRLERARALSAVRALARAVDARDQSTRRHSERVATLTTALAGRLGWDADAVEELREAALVHDVGKIGVPDRVLFKPDRLTREEYEVVKQHAPLGAHIVGGILSDEQTAWIRHHHERWDGRAYPDGLAGESIPEGARLMALADAFDVMTSARPYKDAMPPGAAMAECAAESGRQFWPRAVAALRELWSAGALGEDPAPTNERAMAALRGCATPIEAAPTGDADVLTWPGWDRVTDIPLGGRSKRGGRPSRGTRAGPIRA